MHFDDIYPSLPPFKSAAETAAETVSELPNKAVYTSLVHGWGDRMKTVLTWPELADIQDRIKAVYKRYDMTGAMTIEHNGIKVLYVTYERNPLAFYAEWFKAKTTDDTTSYLK